MLASRSRVLAVAVLAFVLSAVGQSQRPLAVYWLSPGWATFGLALPQGAVSDSVSLAGLPTQTDVKVRWPDGSVRFAVVTAQISRAGDYEISPGAPPNERFPAHTRPDATVTLLVNGTVHVARLSSAQSLGTWLRGPLVEEHRAVLRFDRLPHMGVIFDVRTYRDGTHRVDITVENTIDVPQADEVVYDVAVHLGAPSAPVLHRSSVRHKFLTRWRHVFATNGLQESFVRPDLRPAIAARALPPYLPTVINLERALEGRGVSGTGFGILGFGDLRLPMNDHGGRPEIAPYPDFAAQYLVHRSRRQLEYLIRHGELAGSWAIHLRNEDGSLPTIDEHPQFWLDARWRNEDGFQGPRNTRGGGGSVPVIPGMGEPADQAHQPSLAYVPYLLTGDRYFADELAFWANFTLIGSYPPRWARDGARGLLWGNEVRGIGWALRNLGDAAAYLPDDSALKAYFAAKVMNNLQQLDEYAATLHSGPLRTLFHGRRPEDREPIAGRHYAWIALWEQTYLAWAIDRVMGHGNVAGLDFGAHGASIRDRIARQVLPLFTHPDWPRHHRLQMPYLLAVGIWEGPPSIEASTIRYFSRWAEVRDATFCCIDPATGLSYMARPFAGYYGPEARILLMLLDARAGVPGISPVLTALMDDVADDGRRMSDDLNARSGWAIDMERAGRR